MNFLRVIYTFFIIASFGVGIISCNTQQKEQSVRHVDLDKYQNRKFFGIVDSGYAEVYPFIRFDKNHYQFYTPKSANFEKLYYNIKQMIQYKDRKLNFYHIGGSHLQADVYTHEMRTFLQTNWQDLPGERGLIFPFDLAGTNNPWNFAFSSNNHWKTYKSTLDRPDSLDYGLLGMVLETSDSLINIDFKYKRTQVNHLSIGYVCITIKELYLLNFI